METYQPLWCEECQRHKFLCECALDKSLYRVEYRIVIEVAGGHALSCQENVRVLAYDIIHARMSVQNWALTTPTIWWFESQECTEHTIPIGTRDVAIVGVEKVAENVGKMMQDLGLPEIMPPEE